MEHAGLTQHPEVLGYRGLCQVAAPNDLLGKVWRSTQVELLDDPNPRRMAERLGDLSQPIRVEGT